MTTSNFGEALKRVLVHEGGYAHHRNDPGGPTMKGVTQRVYDGWRRRRGLGTRSVAEINEDELKAIYRLQYWEAVRGDDLPAGLDYCVFDAAVNSGASQASKWLQRALGVAADGQIGEATLAALAGRPVRALINELCERRLAMLRSLSTWKSFGKGWSRRVAQVREAALAMASGRAAPGISTSPPGLRGEDAKARPSDVRLSRTPEGAGGLLAGAASLGALFAEQAERLTFVAEMSPVLRWICALLVLAGVALTLQGALARIRRGEVLA